MLSVSISVFTVTSVSVHFSQTKMIWPGVQCSVVFTDILITSYVKDLDGFEKYLVKSHLIPSAYSRHTRFGYSCLSLALPITKTKPTILYKNENQSNHLRLTDVHVSSSQHIQSLSIFPWIVYANMYNWVNNYVHERERERERVCVYTCVCVCVHMCACTCALMLEHVCMTIAQVSVCVCTLLCVDLCHTNGLPDWLKRMCIWNLQCQFPICVWVGATPVLAYVLMK